MCKSVRFLNQKFLIGMYFDFRMKYDKTRQKKGRHPAAGWKELWNILWHKIN